MTRFDPPSAASRTAAGKAPGSTTGRSVVAPHCVSGASVLDSWSGHAWTAGIQVDRLRDLDVLQVRTRNTLYEITMLRGDSAEALILGGRFFPEPGRAVILGCSLGGAFLKVRGIYCGFSLELYAIGMRIVTSAIQSVELIGDRHLGRVQ